MTSQIDFQEFVPVSAHKRFKDKSPCLTANKLQVTFVLPCQAEQRHLVKQQVKLSAQKKQYDNNP